MDPLSRGLRALRERGPVPAPAPAVPPQHPEPPPSPQALAVLEEARGVVQGALSARVLRRADVLRLRHLHKSSPDSLQGAFRELRAQALQAINQQRLAPEDPAFVMF